MIYFSGTEKVKLNKKMDVIFITDNTNNLNTKELFNKCKKICKKTYCFNVIDEFYDFIKTQKYTKKTNICFIGNEEDNLEYSSLLNFMIYYKEEYKKITTHMKKFNKTIYKDNNSIINESLEYFKEANKDGKCIRGTLINLGYKTHKKDNYSLPLASAYEAFETAILIHDDIIDNADLRRNMPTIHKKYMSDFKDYKQDNTPYHLALCIGDIGFYYVNDYIVSKYRKDKNLARLLNYYNEIYIDTIKGEILDVYLPYIEKNDKSHRLLEDDILKIYKLKTAKYTIIGPFVLGMILSGAKSNEINEMTKILEPIGISFQIKDDILGIMSTTKEIGKPIYSDIEEFKQTILYSYIKINKKEYLEDLLNYYGTKVNEEQLKEVQRIIIESGSLEYAQNKMNELFEYSKEKINKSKLNKEIKSILIGFIKYLELRKK